MLYSCQRIFLFFYIVPMAMPKTKTSRTKKAGNSPTPSGPIGGAPCGHDGCERFCKVRYVGPTSSLHNHHIIHAARGASQVWTAAIVAGLAVVLTGAIAYSAVQAAEEQSNPTMLMLLSLRRIEMRLDRMEPKINKLVAWAQGVSPTGTTMMGGDQINGDKMMGDKMSSSTTDRMMPKPNTACLETCAQSATLCKREAGENDAALHACTETATACRIACAPAATTTAQ